MMLFVVRTDRPGPSPAGPGRHHLAPPEQRAGLASIPQAAVVAVRSVRGLAPGSRVHSAPRRQVREADRTHRPGHGRTAVPAPGTAADPRLPVRPTAETAGAAATEPGRWRRLPTTAVPVVEHSILVRLHAMISGRPCPRRFPIELFLSSAVRSRRRPKFDRSSLFQQDKFGIVLQEYLNSSLYTYIGHIFENSDRFTFSRYVHIFLVLNYEY